MPTELFANNPATTLAAGINSAVTSLTVASSTGFPAAASATAKQFRIIVGSELMIVTNVSGTTWTVTRGAESTVAAAHILGDAVTHVLTAATLSALPTTYAPGVSVSAYGAVGDFTTDDTTALQAALTAARAVDGKLWLEPNKTYRTTASLNVTGVHLVGQGSTIKLGNGIAADRMLTSDGACTIEGLTLDGNKANTTGAGTPYGIYVYGGAGWTGTATIRDVTVQNVWNDAIRGATVFSITDAATAPDSRIVVDNVTVQDCDGIGVALFGLAGPLVANSRFDTNAHGVYAQICRDATIIGNVAVSNVGHGIVSTYGRGTRIVGNSCVDNGDSGATIGGGDAALVAETLATVVGNLCSGNAEHGITLDITLTTTGTGHVPCYSTVTGNVCEDNGVHGIHIQQSSYVSITGNICRDNGHTGIGLATWAATVSGNNCTGNAQDGIGMFGNPASPNYGGHRLGVNHVANNTVGGYLVESASVTDVKWATLTTTNPAP
jgi:parallel beta-helix repeat protein